MTLLALAVAAFPGTGGSGEGGAPAAPPSTQGDTIPSLREAYGGKPLIGAAMTAAMLRDARTNTFLAHQFDVVVAEYEMKPEAIAPSEGRYDFGAADAIVDWASRRGLKVRGHCLVWAQREVSWMLTKDGKPVPREVLVARLRTYIHDVVGHFRGRVWAWDVVNEAFSVGEPNVETENGWRKSDWYRIIGPEYIALAFQFAHEADPAALLFYNDYETQNPVRRAMIVELVRTLQGRGIAIHGVGHQAHLLVTHAPVAELEATLQAVARLGLRNHVTELDLSLRDAFGAPVPPITSPLLGVQAERWRALFQMFRRNASRLDAVVLWGVNDESSWLGPPDQPLLFTGLLPKPAFWVVLDQAQARSLAGSAPSR